VSGDPKGGATTLSPRANIALLTLQLRAAVQEADAAEADAGKGGVDVDASLQQLRARLDPLMAERRIALDAELANERAAAAEAIAVAHREAAEILAAAEAARLATRVEPVDVPAPEDDETAPEAAAALAEVAGPAAIDAAVDPETHAPVDPEHVDLIVAPVDDGSELDDALEDDEELESHDEPEVVFAEFAREGDAPSTELALWPPPPSNTVTLDVDAFAKVMGAVMASVLDERMANWQTPQHPYPYTMQMPVPMVIQAAPAPTTPPKQGFWSSAKHPDVILMVIAMVIVLVVLAAWLA
jgi:hypothetical protein